MSLASVKARIMAILLILMALLVPSKNEPIVNTKAYLAMIIGGFITMLVGGALFVFSYVVIDAIIGAAGTLTSSNLTNSMNAGIDTMITGLQLASLVFVAIGFYMVVSVFIGIGGTAMGRGGA